MLNEERYEKRDKILSNGIVVKEVEYSYLTSVGAKVGLSDGDLNERESKQNEIRVFL